MNGSGSKQLWQDQNWQDVYTYLSTRLKASDAVLAPDGLKSIAETHQKTQLASTPQTFQNYFASTYLKAEDFDWVVIHKGMVNDIDAKFLDQVDDELSPVFANDVFVVFSQKKSWRQFFVGRSPHVKAYYTFRKQCQQSPLNASASSNLDKKNQDVILSKKLLRNADVLLCSYPKCGRTWLRFMLSSYFHLLSQSHEEMDFRHMACLVPAAGKSDKSVDAEGTLLIKPVQTGALKLPLVVATHLNYSNRRIQMIFSSKDTIFLIRNIYDVLVSQYFELVYRRGNNDTEDIWAFIREKELLESYVSYLNGWAENLVPDRHITLTYEGLKARTEIEFIRLIQFLNLEVIPEQVQEAIRLASFENMQQIQRKKREKRGIDDKRTNFSGLRVRRGKIGGHRDWLNESAIQYIQAYCHKHLNPSATALFQRHGLEI